MAWCSVANHFKRIHCIACITVYYVVLAEFKTRIGIPAGNAWVLLIFCKEGEKCSNHCMWSPNFLHTTARNWIQTWFHASLNQAGMKRRLEFDFGALSCLRITSIAENMLSLNLQVYMCAQLGECTIMHSLHTANMSVHKHATCLSAFQTCSYTTCHCWSLLYGFGHSTYYEFQYWSMWVTTYIACFFVYVGNNLNHI